MPSSGITGNQILMNNVITAEVDEDMDDEEMKEFLRLLADLSGKQNKSFSEPSTRDQLLNQASIGEISDEEKDIMEKLGYLDNIDKGASLAGTALGAGLGFAAGGPLGMAVGSSLGGIAGQVGGSLLEDFFAGDAKESLAVETAKRQKTELERLEKLAKEEEEAKRKSALLDAFFARYL